jgi:3-hydroxymyristoyl/3-hydroxydecanoyl-(acyl carrier protein) dehydratase
MPEQLRTFSFVDRIIDIDRDTRARGRFAVPAALAHFSPCLVAEAVGQLAAWVAMARDDFRRRPVAALAGEGLIVGDAKPGRTLQLGVEIEQWDPDAVAYAGWARCDGTPVIELRHCVGALLPLEDFDDPTVARQRFALLREVDAQPGLFAGVAEAEAVVLEHDPGQRVRALLRVPVYAPFFADHFPRRAVFPATLLLDTQIRFALELARDVLPCPAGVSLRPVRVADVKLRSFILPGQAVDITAEKVAAVGDSVAVALAAKVGEKRVATAGVKIAAQALS